MPVPREGHASAAAAIVVTMVAHAAAVGACAVRLPAGDGGEELGIPCTGAMECPQPDNACLLAYCMEQQCVHVPAPEGQLPEQEQTAGDCQLLYCDGNGEVAEYPARHDVPADDDNPCTEEVCDGTQPKHRPKAVGTRCGEKGICNGAGKCGQCRPKAAECQGHAVRACDADGQWTDPQPCAAGAPVCSNARCVGLVEVAVGSAHACARFEDGTVRCWGAGDRGQLGQGGPAAARPPTWGAGFRAPAIGPRHACALDASGAVWCWGANDFGQIGDGSYQSTTGPTRAQVGPASAVAVGAFHSCTLTLDGKVHCWGRNDRGQLGSGKAPPEPLPAAAGRSSGGAPQAKPQPIADLKGAAELMLDEQLTCLRVGGQPSRCWGAVSFPQPEPTDDPDELKKLAAASSTSPVAVAALPASRQLAAGADFSCAVAQDGTVHCWGANDHGQLGDGTQKSRFRAAPVTGLSSVRHLALGDAFACALLESGEVRCWGANDHGQLGTGKQGPGLRAAPIAGLAGVKQLSAGAQFACALTTDGPLLCWGSGASGQLGNGSGSNAPRPVGVSW